MRNLAIIPARGGSKGFSRKNIQILANVPLIAHTIRAAINSRFITDIVVSSDDDEILDISKSFGADVLKRPSELAQDNTPSEPVIAHVLKSLNINFDYIILLQPTSPLRNEMHIDKAFKSILKFGTNTLISVKEVDNKFLKSFFIKDKFLKPICDPKFPFLRRQDLPSVYMPNGAIYISKTSYFLTTLSLFSDDTLPFLMNSEESIDIDSADDLAACEDILSR